MKITVTVDEVGPIDNGALDETVRALQVSLGRNSLVSHNGKLFLNDEQLFEGDWLVRSRGSAIRVVKPRTMATVLGLR